MTTLISPEAWHRAEWKLYIFYREDGRRLYVGITSRTYPERWQEHRDHERNKYWYAEIDHKKTETRPLGYMFRWQAERIERTEIRLEGGTLANIKDNNGRGERYVDTLIAQKLGTKPPSAADPRRGVLLFEFAYELIPWMIFVATISGTAILLILDNT